MGGTYCDVVQGMYRKHEVKPVNKTTGDLKGAKSTYIDVNA